MRARVQKWGNSLAVRIPKSFASEVKLRQDALVEISLVDGKLMVAPVEESSFTLAQLLAGITKKNLHREIETGGAVGNEVVTAVRKAS